MKVVRSIEKLSKLELKDAFVSASHKITRLQDELKLERHKKSLWRRWSECQHIADMDGGRSMRASVWDELIRLGEVKP
jgi:hypothetical protein